MSAYAADTMRACPRPEKGARILFFTGGSGLRGLSRFMVRLSWNTRHLVTPFDSGGSSGSIRAHLGIPAVGDIRSRLMDLADRSNPHTLALINLLSYRLPQGGRPENLHAELELFAQGAHPLLQALNMEERRRLCGHFRFFCQRIPSHMDLRSASIGNIVLASSRVQQGSLDAAIQEYTRIMPVHGFVCPVAEENVHLAVRLANGQIICGQDRFTGKRLPALTVPIQSLWTCTGYNDPSPKRATLKEHTRALIASADLICYAMGSFYSSLLASLQPQGMGAAIATARCPKIFIPNSTPDPELYGHDLHMQVQQLLHTLQADETLPTKALLNTVLIDSQNGQYVGGNEKLAQDCTRIAQSGIQILNTRLSTPTNARIDERILSPLLCTLSMER